jgi:hypothetical protein
MTRPWASLARLEYLCWEQDWTLPSSCKRDGGLLMHVFYALGAMGFWFRHLECSLNLTR